MKNSFRPHTRRWLRLVILMFTFGIFVAPVVHAGGTFDLRLIRDEQGISYNFYTEITNISLPFSLFSPAKRAFIRVSTE